MEAVQSGGADRASSTSHAARPRSPRPRPASNVVDVATTATTTASDTPAPGGELLARALDALVRHGSPLSSVDLAGAVFGAAPVAGTDAASPWTVMLDRLLAPSPLLLRDQHGQWSLAAWHAPVQRLADVEFAVLDVETTGLAPGRHRLIEVAAVLVRDGATGAHFQRLINPGRHIPQFITQFTGISEAAVARAKPADVVLPRLHAFVDNHPIVGHNIGFDLSFLNYESAHAKLALAFPHEGVDTIALARRYLTGMRRAKLDRVAAALHIPVHTRHRALPDAMLTARIFTLLLAQAREDGCGTLDDLWAVLGSVEPVRESMPHRRATGSLLLNPAWRRDFPARPGVYLMKDAAGEVIYVGKAKCLKDRLASYYSQPLGYTRKIDGLLQNVAEIETRVLGSELEALLVESQLIKALQPRYNVQLRNYELYPFIKVDVSQAYPRFYATREVSADGARYFGPFRSRRVVDATIELLQRVFPVRTCTRSLPPAAPPSEPCLRYHLKRCPGPCRGALDDASRERYRESVAEACAFLGGQRDDLIDRLKREMFAAAARQDYERAARLRDALRDADQVLLGQRLITGAVEANNLLIVYPSADDESLEVYLVRHGRLARQCRTAQNRESLTAGVGELVASAVAAGAPPARVGRAEVDQINIIARWIHHHSEDYERAFFPLPSSDANADVVASFVEHVTTNVLKALADAASGLAAVGTNDDEEEA